MKHVHLGEDKHELKQTNVSPFLFMKIQQKVMASYFFKNQQQEKKKYKTTTTTVQYLNTRKIQ